MEGFPDAVVQLVVHDGAPVLWLLVGDRLQVCKGTHRQVRDISMIQEPYVTRSRRVSGGFLPTLGKGVWSFWEVLSTKMPNLGIFVSIKWSILGKSCVHLFC